MTDEQEEIEENIESLDTLHEMEEKDITEYVKAFSQEGLSLRRKRKEIRYKLYRIQSQALGRSEYKVPEGFKEHFEEDPNFGGWRFFGVTWDVLLTDPWTCINRDKSVQEEWDDVVRAKFPVLKANGGIHYPDIKVKKAVEAEAKRQEQNKKEQDR